MTPLILISLLLLKILPRNISTISVVNIIDPNNTINNIVTIIIDPNIISISNYSIDPNTTSINYINPTYK